ncbi:FAD binding domain protein [Penicillium cosmopolitanum]|uniref:FAD binding domain protein n=1 Tax=Penicillium cosmopolitanum TaxID=1131564 RepID=A0A9W9VQP1_9EURO|nr:FAD binding domain protein [Penicillium cosmopolitanum]KAJ5387582.1 FAD binding domain protein [Penicillium cosmopolitanum]
MHFTFITLAFLAASPVIASSKCKTSPHDPTWPSTGEWTSLNQSIQGGSTSNRPRMLLLLPRKPFQITTQLQRESNDYSIWNNNSCLPPGVSGYSKEKGCSVGGLPRYIVNATTEQQVATAMKWASDHNIRIVIKSTGHDLCGRSTGAYSLSIWTQNFNYIQHEPSWKIPGTNKTEDVMICGGGNNWGSVYTAAHRVNRTVVGGEDATVGLGGLIQNGGHGLLSSTYGLASDQVYQVTIVTTDGRRLVANDQQNQDLFWAVRGAGGGQFGIITEFVLRTHPVPANVVSGGLSFNSSVNGNASWAALAEIASEIPNLMDAGITGTVMSVTGEQAGPVVTISLTGFNSSARRMNDTIHQLATKITNIGHRHGYLNLSFTPPTSSSYWSSTKPNYLSSQSAGIPRGGAMLLFGLQGGPGPAKIAEKRRGSVLPAWRSAYAHVMAYGSSFNESGDAKTGLEIAANFYEKVKEPVWREWGPNTGSYMNEGNPFSSTWKQDFYGVNYDRLLDVKLEYDPSESIFVQSGIGSDKWDYDLHSGLLCRADDE